MSTDPATHLAHFQVCKHLSELPPVVGEWQQTCQQPACVHFRLGECANPNRLSESAPCPFDGKQLPLRDA